MMLLCAALFATVVVGATPAFFVLLSWLLARRVQRDRDVVQASIFFTGLRAWAKNWNLLSWGNMALAILVGVRRGTLPDTKAVQAAYLAGVPAEMQEYWQRVLEGVAQEGAILDLTRFEKP